MNTTFQYLKIYWSKGTFGIKKKTSTHTKEKNKKICTTRTPQKPEVRPNGRVEISHS